MKVVELNIGSTSALLIGEKSEKVFLFVHGLHGRKEEALAFAKEAVPKGYQVLSIDLPVERKPWEVLPLLNEVRDYLYENWKSVSVCANFPHGRDFFHPIKSFLRNSDENLC